MIETAALLYVLIVAVVIVFQCCLIAGAPWGRLTQGGRREGALDAPGRIAAAASIALLACMAAGITSVAGLPPGWPRWTSWTTVGLQALSTVMNWITPSAAERRLWGPVTGVMLGLAGYVVLGGT